MGVARGFTAVTGATYTAAQYNTNTRDTLSELCVFSTAGDLMYASGAYTLARLGIGTDGKYLGANGSAPAWREVYPVGCVYISTISTNPATVFGFGTWVAFGAGRVLVGVGTSDAAYAAAATGGESTHVLSAAEMPAHTHPITVALVDPVDGAADGSQRNIPLNNASTTTGSTGSGSAHNNMPPYVVVYMWKRTA